MLYKLQAWESICVIECLGLHSGDLAQVPSEYGCQQVQWVYTPQDLCHAVDHACMLPALDSSSLLNPETQCTVCCKS